MKVLINESITIVRDGNRVAPTPGKIFDLTKEEISQLDDCRPSAYSKLKDLEEDPASIEVDQQSVKVPATPVTTGKGKATTDDKAADL